MPELISYLLKVNVALVLFCAGYYLVLRRLTFYTLNRVYLVLALLFSTLYPKVNLTAFFERHETVMAPVQVIVYQLQSPAKALIEPLTKPDYWQIALLIFWAGVVIMAAKLCVQLISLARLHLRSKQQLIDDYKVRVVNTDIGPFSFWRSIYVNPAALQPTELKSVLEHEQIHVSEWHTLDILLGELSTVFYWFNPGVWMMKKAIKENIEFITDRRILQKGIDSKTYQYSLLSVSMSANSNTIVNHFNISTIKKRIIMMNSKRSSTYNLTRYVFVLPVVAALLLVFTITKADVVKTTAKNVKAALTAISIKSNKVSAAVANIVSPKTPAVKAGTASLLSAKTPSLTLAADTTPKLKLNIKKTLTKSQDSVAFIIDGVTKSKDELNQLNPDQIASINIINSASAKEKGLNEHGAIFIVTKGNQNSPAVKDFMTKYGLNASSPNFGGRISNITISRTASISASDSARAAVTVEGRQIAGRTVARAGRKDLTEVTVTGHPAKVRSVVKGNSVTITSDSVTYVPRVNEVVVTGYGTYSDSENAPLIVIDGKEVPESVWKRMPAADISTITILKDKSATATYGNKAKNGVIVVTTKKKK